MNIEVSYYLYYEIIMDKLSTLESLLSIYNTNLVMSRNIPAYPIEVSSRDLENAYSFNPNQ